MPALFFMPTHDKMRGMSKTQKLLAIYERLLRHNGPRGWWPGETRDEVIIGAILTQSISWRNVTRAIDNLRAATLLSLGALYNAELETIEPLIIPTRYYRQKALKLKAFCHHLYENYEGSLDEMFRIPLDALREELLTLRGIGPETADCILLYAGELPSFPGDAYTKRIFARLGLLKPDATYDEMRRLFMDNLPPEVGLYNDYHAQIDGLGNQYCAPKDPRCGECPIRDLCKKLVDV